jgi:dihydrofolate synthase/folylpolyglutamate synthase
MQTKDRRNTMDYKEAIEYINGTSWQGKRPCLDRISGLLDALGSPQDGLKAVHIAGTNGKGSTAAMTASVLKAAGYKTGLYTSPHLLRFNERIRVNGKAIEDAELADIVGRIKPLADALPDHPSEFELATAAAFVYFSEAKCDVAVLETGLGGRFDATNVIKAPECSVICRIGLDHTAVLGDTVAKIAAEKAGIIKPGRPCVLYSQPGEAEDVIKAACERLDAPLTVTAPEELVPQFDSIDGQSFTYRGVEYALPLLGRAQLQNAAVAVETVDVLRAAGWEISGHALEAGLYSVSWPARFEVVSDDPYFIVDGGHNPQCMESVAANLAEYFPDKKHAVLLGVMADKDWQKMADILAPAADEFVAAQPAGERALPWQELAEYIEALGKPVTGCDSLEDAVRMALSLGDEDTVVCACGSIYMAGVIRGCFGLGGENL